MTLAHKLLPDMDKQGLRCFGLLFLENFCFNAAHNTLSLLAPRLLELGAGKAFLGLFGTLNTLIMLAILVFSPRLLLRLAKIPALVVGFGLLAAGDGLALIFPSSLAWMLVCRSLGTLSYVFSYTMLMGMVYELSPEQTRTGSIALFGVSGLVSNPVASLAGEAVLGRLGPSGLWLQSACFGFLALGGLWFLSRGPAPGEWRKHTMQDGTTAKASARSYSQPLGQCRKSGFILGVPRLILEKPELRHLALTSLFFGAAFPAWMAYLPALSQQNWGASQLSLFTIPFALVSVVLRLGFSRRMDSSAPKAMAGLALGSMAGAFALAALPTGMAGFFCAGALYGLAHSLLFPILSALHVKAGPPGEKTAFNNAFILESSLGAVILVPLAGMVGDSFGYGALFGTFMVFSLVLLASLVIRSREWVQSHTE